MSTRKKSLNLGAFTTAEAAYLLVKGMTCPHCAVRINARLLQLEGVLLSFVLFEQNLVALLYDPAQISRIDLVTAVSAIRHTDYHFEAELVAHVSADEVFAALH